MRPWPNPTQSRPWPVPSAEATTIHHVSDGHYAYRSWSTAEHDHMRADILDGLMPAVHASVNTGDISDGTYNTSGLPLDVQDAYLVPWLHDVAKGVPTLWTPGNHDYRDRPPYTKEAWEAVYGQPVLKVLDLADYRLIGFGPDYYTGNGSWWVIPDSTFAWIDAQAQASPNPVIIVNHYPPAELVDGNNWLSVQPPDAFTAVIDANPKVVGLLCGHMHYELDSFQAAQFVTLGSRTVPVVCDVSSMLSLPSGYSRDMSGQVPSTSAYVSLLGDRWEVRYRGHGPRAWVGPGGARLTTMDLATATISYGM